jgi:hypothetical protein
MALMRGEVQDIASAARATGVETGAPVQEQPDRLEVAPFSGMQARSPACAVFRIEIRPGIEQRLRGAKAAARGGLMEIGGHDKLPIYGE